MNQTQKNYVPNNVFKFRVNSDIYLPPIYVYTEPHINDEKQVQAAYFTKEKLNEIKEQLIDYIRNSPTVPFDIYCVDADSNYNVTEEEIFKILENINNFISNQKQMPGEFQQLIQDNFWDLVD